MSGAACLHLPVYNAAQKSISACCSCRVVFNAVATVCLHTCIGHIQRSTMVVGHRIGTTAHDQCSSLWDQCMVHKA
jgi:hypothetical protein